MLEYLTVEKLEQIATTSPAGHWDCTPLEKRWDYHRKAIDIIKKLLIVSPNHVLEMGTMGASLVVGSHTIDCSHDWNFQGKSPTYLHDAKDLPWPIEDKKYELFVALRVYQHLAPMQRQCFLEAKRIARRIILVVPEHYSNQVWPESKGITCNEMLRWNEGIRPTVHLRTRMGDLYFWNTDALAVRTVPVWALGLWRKIGSVFSRSEREVPPKSAAKMLRNLKADLSGCLEKANSGGGRVLIVEFIGPSGVGKSALCRELMRKQDPADRLCTYEELIRRKNRPVHRSDTRDFERYAKLLGLEKLCEGNFSKEVLSYSHEVVDREVQLEQIEDQESIIVLEEGMVHNFSDALLDLRALDPKEFGLLVRDRVVINCVAPPSTVVSRIRQREAQGHLMSLHVGKSDEELLDLCSEELKNKAELMRNLREFEVPCLDVDMENDVPGNLQKIQSFLQNLAAAWRVSAAPPCGPA